MVIFTLNLKIIKIKRKKNMKFDSLLFILQNIIFLFHFNFSWDCQFVSAKFIVFNPSIFSVRNIIEYLGFCSKNVFYPLGNVLLK